METAAVTAELIGLKKQTQTVINENVHDLFDLRDAYAAVSKLDIDEPGSLQVNMLVLTRLKIYKLLDEQLRAISRSCATFKNPPEPKRLYGLIDRHTRQLRMMIEFTKAVNSAAAPKMVLEFSNSPAMEQKYLAQIPKFQKIKQVIHDKQRWLGLLLSKREHLLTCDAPGVVVNAPLWPAVPGRVGKRVSRRPVSAKGR